ncbi:MAG: MalY/PatB family protein [Woeseiaceae bacterium]
MTTNTRRDFLKLVSAASTGALITNSGSAAAQAQGVASVEPPAPSSDNPFDVVHDRRGTNSIKWDFAYDGGVNDEVAYQTGADAASGPLPMSLSDMEFQTSPRIIEALQKRARHGIYGYTKPTSDYFRSITNWISSHYGWRVEEEWLLKTAGVMPAISMAIQAYTDPGDQIVIQTPVFYPFGTVVENNERVLLRNSLLLEDDKYVMDFDDLEQKAADPLTKMIIFCSPHNPVGRVWSRQELMQLGEICEKHDLLIVSDEIHCDLVYSWAEFTTFGVVDERLLDRLVVCNSPSKSFNLPGLKTATAIIPNPELREDFNIKLRNMEQLFSDNIFGTLALQTAYEQGEPWLGQLKEYLEGNYLFLKKYIDDHLPALRLQEAEGLYLVWIDCRGLGLDEEALRKLFFDEAKVYPVQGGTYGAEGEGFIRLNIACPRQILEEALTRVEDAVSRI